MAQGGCLPAAGGTIVWGWLRRRRRRRAASPASCAAEHHHCIPTAGPSLPISGAGQPLAAVQAQHKVSRRAKQPPHSGSLPLLPPLPPLLPPGKAELEQFTRRRSARGWPPRQLSSWVCEMSCIPEAGQQNRLTVPPACRPSEGSLQLRHTSSLCAYTPIGAAALYAAVNGPFRCCRVGSQVKPGGAPQVPGAQAGE